MDAGRLRWFLALLLLTAIVSVHSAPVDEDEVAAASPHSLDDVSADKDDQDEELSEKDTSVPRAKMPHPTVRRTESEDRDGSAREDKHFTGIPYYLQASHNISRLSHMLHRVIHQYKIQSMVDIPCRSHSRWMGRFLQNIKAKKGKPFAYYCVDSNKMILELAETRIGDVRAISTNYIHRKFWKLPMPKADLVFAWEGLEKMQNKNVLSLLKLLVDGKRHKFLLIGSSPSVRNSDLDVLNIRKSPFSYNLPKRIYKELAVTPSRVQPEKHMYLYEITDMRSGK